MSAGGRVVNIKINETSILRKEKIGNHCSTVVAFTWKFTPKFTFSKFEFSSSHFLPILLSHLTTTTNTQTFALSSES